MNGKFGNETGLALPAMAGEKKLLHNAHRSSDKENQNNNRDGKVTFP